jgi:hypothetical protein
MAMPDDMREPGPRQALEEREWSRSEPVLLVLKALALAAVALAVGTCVSELVVPVAHAQPPVFARVR